MRDQKQRYLVVEQGRTLKQYFKITNPLTGTVYDLADTGYTRGALQVRTAHASDGGELLMDLTTENGGVSIDYIANDGTGESWSGYIFAMPESTGALLPWNDAVYDLVAINENGMVDTISRGPAMLVLQVSLT